MIIVTVPAHNETRNLQKCVETLVQQLPSLNEEYCIVIAEDGSTDGTDILAKTMEETYPNVIHFHYPNKLGRGLALKRAWRKVDGDIYAFIDADLATDMKYFPQLINAIREGNDLATGSRYIKGAKVERPVLRDFTSRVYNMLIRMMYKDNVFDHQIGFKAFSKRLIKNEMDKCVSDTWFWDTEIIVRSIHENYKCVEFPVEWKEKQTNKTPIKRLFSDIRIHGTGILKLKSTL
ncbi:MAG: glycosyltransferase [Candidatus Bathyarchaeia archaeon]